MTTTFDTVGIERLTLSPARPPGYVPKPSPTLQRRVTKYGVLEPIAVRSLPERKFEILSNAPVWVAAGRAGLRDVPVACHKDLSETEVADIVAEHYTLAAHDPIEEARSFEDQLEEFGGRSVHGAISRFARQQGLSRTKVAHALRLLDLPEAIQYMVSVAELTPGQARPLISLKDHPEQGALAAEIERENLSVREIERIASRLRAQSSTHSKPVTSNEHNPDVQRLELDVANLIGSPFEIRGDEAVFNFFGDFDVLEGILKRLGYEES